MRAAWLYQVLLRFNFVGASLLPSNRVTLDGLKYTVFLAMDTESGDYIRARFLILSSIRDHEGAVVDYTSQYTSSSHTSDSLTHEPHVVEAYFQ